MSSAVDPEMDFDKIHIDPEFSSAGKSDKESI